MKAEAQVSYRVVLDPRHQTKLYPEILNMPVRKVHKKMGESFEKGDILIELEDGVLKTNYQRAEAEVARTMTQLDAIKKLHEDKISSNYELRNAESEYKKSVAELAMAMKNLEATKIKAPYKGKVEDVYIEEYELPKEEHELIELVDDQVLIARLLVTSDLLPKLYEGKPIVIAVQEIGENVEAKIKRIGAMIDPSSSTIKIEAEIDNRDGRLKAGMIGRVTIE